MSFNESFGASLKKQRELRGIRLQEVAEATHIRLIHLKALESDHFEALPGLTFLKGYVRAYAQYVGLNPEEVLVRLNSFVEGVDLEKKSPLHRRGHGARIALGVLLLALGALLWVKGCLS